MSKSLIMQKIKKKIHLMLKILPRYVAIIWHDLGVRMKGTQKLWPTVCDKNAATSWWS